MNLQFLEVLNKLKDSCKLFDGFSSQDIKSLLHIAEVKKIDDEGQIIFRQGEEGDSLYLILVGNAEIFYSSNIRGCCHINELSPGDIFGETSLITTEKRSASARVSKAPFIALTLSEGILKQDYRIQAKIYKNFSRILAGRLAEKNREVRLLQKKN